MKLPKLKRKNSVESAIDKFVENGCPEPPQTSAYFAERQVEWEHELDAYDKELEAYKTEAEVLESLAKAQSSASSRRISPDTILTVAGSIASVLLILNYEKTEIVTSKAIGFVTKLR